MGAVVGRLLLVSNVRRHLDASKSLREKGWLTHLARDTRSALQLWIAGAYDSVILALDEPSQSHRLIDALATVRPFPTQRPSVYVIGALPRVQPDILLRMGVRWLPDTTTVDELAYALGRRNTQEQRGPLRRIGVLELDLVGRRAYLRGVPLPLRAMEFSLLSLLMEHAGSWVGLERVETALGCKGTAPHKTLAVHLCRLRSALGDRPRPRVIQSRRQRGYRLNPGALDGAAPLIDHRTGR